MDGTFKVMRDSLYVQLVIIHAFLKSGDNIKQVPQVNVVMSRRQLVDYAAVFKEIATLMGGELKVE